MAWLVVDKDGTEAIFQSMPFRSKYLGKPQMWTPQTRDSYVNLPKGSIQKLIGKELKWEDEPVEI